MFIILYIIYLTFCFRRKVIRPKGKGTILVENGFALVKRTQQTNVNWVRDCHSFVSAYKTLVLNNLISPHSPGANCEEDFTEGSLTSFKNLFDKAAHPMFSTYH